MLLFQFFLLQPKCVIPDDVLQRQHCKLTDHRTSTGPVSMSLKRCRSAYKDLTCLTTPPSLPPSSESREHKRINLTPAMTPQFIPTPTSSLEKHQRCISTSPCTVFAFDVPLFLEGPFKDLGESSHHDPSLIDKLQDLSLTMPSSPASSISC
jgi:hypothetical protein